MKAITDCSVCRKKIYKEAETEYLQHEYKFFEESAYSMAYFAFCGIFTSLIRKGRTKKYIKSLAEYENREEDRQKTFCQYDPDEWYE